MNTLHYAEATMTSEEAESIVRRLAERSAASGGTKVGELAEALGVSPEEVAQMLAEVRRKPKRRIARRERRVWLLSGLSAFLIAGLAFGSMQALRFREFRPEENATAAVADTVSVTAAIPEDQVFQIFMDGRDVGGALRADLEHLDESGAAMKLSNDLETWLKAHAKDLPYSPATISESQAIEARRAAQEGRWQDVAGVRMVLLELRRPSDSGQAMRWARVTVPLYLGDDALIADAVGRERRRLVEGAIKEASKGLGEAEGQAVAPATQ